MWRTQAGYTNEDENKVPALVLLGGFAKLFTYEKVVDLAASKDINQQLLILQCKAGSEQARFVLYKRYADAMLNTAFRILNNREDAEDVVQEAFLKAFLQISRYRGDSTFGAWLKRIVINQSINTLKKRKLKWQDLESQNEKINASANLRKEQDYNDNFNYSVEEARNAIQQLPDGYRTVFSLYLLEGYDHEEIAEILNVSIATSLTQYHRAKKKLYHILTNVKKLSS